MLGLRYAADLRPLSFVACWFALQGLLWTTGFALAPWLLLLVLGLTMGPIAHNHVHGGTFKDKRLDQLWTWIVTISYGFPVMAWIPTHLQNHHVYGNRPGDESATWRWTERNTTWMAILYFPMSAFHQTKLTNAYLSRLWAKHRSVAIRKTSEYVVWGAWVAAAFLIDWRKALLFVGVPMLVSLYSVHLFNYVQHVGCDWDAKYNQSRNFVGPWANALLFNNGFHTIHHLNGGLHWSLAPAAHAKVEHLIHPSLNQKNAIWWLFRSYVLAPFIGEEKPLEFAGHPGSVAKLPKAPPPGPTWSIPVEEAA